MTEPVSQQQSEAYFSPGACIQLAKNSQISGRPAWPCKTTNGEINQGQEHFLRATAPKSCMCLACTSRIL